MFVCVQIPMVLCVNSEKIILTFQKLRSHRTSLASEVSPKKKVLGIVSVVGEAPGGRMMRCSMEPVSLMVSVIVVIYYLFLCD